MLWRLSTPNDTWELIKSNNSLKLQMKETERYKYYLNRLDINFKVLDI